MSGSGAERRIRRRILVSGRVQGVGYRASFASQALGLDPELQGYVRNLPDGRVEAVIEGAEESVLALVRWSASGPSYARVERLEVLEEPLAPGLPRMEVRR